MKIVYLSSSAQLGGVENVLLDLCASLRAAEPGWPLHLVAPSEGPLVGAARALGVGVTVLPFPPALARLGDAALGGARARLTLAARLLLAAPATALYARRLRRTLRALDPEVIHANGLKVHALGAWARPRRAALVWHLHDYLSGRPFAARLLRRAVRGCDALIANSRSVARDTRAALGGHLAVGHVYNAVDLGRFTPEGARADLDSLAGLPPAEAGTVRVGLVATLARWKGHRTFLRALSLLPAGLRVRGYVTGDALYQTEGSQYRLEELRRLAGEFGVSDRVGFTGFLPDAAEAFRALDVVVHASTAPEPFGLVIAEAMACGRAVVAAASGGAAEIVSEGLDALGHAPGDAEALAAQIARLAADPDLRASLGRAARRSAERRFDRARLAGEWSAVYRELGRRGEIETWTDRMDRIKEIQI